jgi:hypothetical protein
MPESPTSPAALPAPQRWNAVRHGVLSGGTVLPWEERREEFDALLVALAEEHAPVGPTEGHLVEEIAGTMWRKRRLRLAEAAAYRDELRREAVSGAAAVAGAALLPLTGRDTAPTDLGQALTATTDTTARGLGMIEAERRAAEAALALLRKNGSGAYEDAAAALGPAARDRWRQAVADLDTLLSFEADAPRPTTEGLRRWLEGSFAAWLAGAREALEHRGAVREQAVGAAYATDRLDLLARYETHLDRKLARALDMLLRLQDLRAARRPEGG